MGQFTVRASKVGGPDELRLSGEIDAAVADALTAKGLACLQTTAPGLIVDMSEVTFLDSSGISGLVRIWDHAADLDKTVVIANPSARVNRVLRITALDSVFGVVVTT